MRRAGDRRRTRAACPKSCATARPASCARWATSTAWRRRPWTSSSIAGQVEGDERRWPPPMRARGSRSDEIVSQYEDFYTTCPRLSAVARARPVARTPLLAPPACSSRPRGGARGERHRRRVVAVALAAIALTAVANADERRRRHRDRPHRASGASAAVGAPSRLTRPTLRHRVARVMAVTLAAFGGAGLVARDVGGSRGHVALQRAAQAPRHTRQRCRRCPRRRCRSSTERGRVDEMEKGIAARDGRRAAPLRARGREGSRGRRRPMRATRRTVPVASGDGTARAAVVGGVVAFAIAVALLAPRVPALRDACWSRASLSPGYRRAAAVSRAAPARPALIEGRHGRWRLRRSSLSGG